jgi:hypothetical protein
VLPTCRHRTGFQQEMQENDHLWLEWAFHNQFLAAGAPLIWISQIFWLKLLKPVFCNLKSKFSWIKKKYQQFYAKGRPFNCYHFRPLWFSLDYTFNNTIVDLDLCPEQVCIRGPYGLGHEKIKGQKLHCCHSKYKFNLCEITTGNERKQVCTSYLHFDALVRMYKYTYICSGGLIRVKKSIQRWKPSGMLEFKYKETIAWNWHGIKEVHLNKG